METDFVLVLSEEGTEMCSFGKFVLVCPPELQAMGNVQEPRGSDCDIRASEPCRTERRLALPYYDYEWAEHVSVLEPFYITSTSS